MTNEILLAGFGGQGILFMGKMLAYFGLYENKEVSWLPSYGPEMRGGTCNCSVCISDDPIGSPLVDTPNTLIVMNTPSYDKFIDSVVPGGTVIIDSTLVDAKCDRTDINVYYVPATALANVAPDGNLPTQNKFVWQTLSLSESFLRKRNLPRWKRLKRLWQRLSRLRKPIL